MSYQIEAVCGNCGCSSFIKVKGGEPVKDQKCPICECREMVRGWGISAIRLATDDSPDLPEER